MSRFEIVDCLQNTDEWFAARAGRVTGSQANWVMSKPTASGEAAGKKDYRLQLAVERIGGQPEINDFTNANIRRGTEMEPLARLEVEVKHNALFHETGFLVMKDMMAGVSLDGSTADFSKTLEIKCPKSSTHLSYLQAQRLPPQYRWQATHGLYVTGAESCVFASYDDRMPVGLHLFSVEVFAKDLPLDEYHLELEKFIASVDELEAQLRELQKEYIK